MKANSFPVMLANIRETAAFDRKKFLKDKTDDGALQFSYRNYDNITT